MEELFNSGKVIILKWEETGYDGEVPDAIRKMSFPLLSIEDQRPVFIVRTIKFKSRNDTFISYSRTGDLILEL